MLWTVLWDRDARRCSKKTAIDTSSDQRPVKAQQRCGPDGDCDFQHTLRSNEHRAQAQQDAVQWAEPRRLLSRSIQDQQLMFQKKRFDNDCAGTARRRGPDRRDNEMSYQDEPIPHAVNND